MKKRILCTMLLLLICGCSNQKEEYANFKHYQLKAKESDIYVYYDNKGEKNVYAIANITPKEYMSKLFGLFYQITDNEYILLSKIEVNATTFEYQFYDNKLYTVGSGENSGLHEYTLNKEKVKQKELKFKIDNGLVIQKIEDVKEDKIYYGCLATGYNETKTIECRFDTATCRLWQQ